MWIEYSYIPCMTPVHLRFGTIQVGRPRYSLVDALVNCSDHFRNLCNRFVHFDLCIFQERNPCNFDVCGQFRSDNSRECSPRISIPTSSSDIFSHRHRKLVH